MTMEEVISVLENEKKCVLRDSCERSECASCDLVMPIEQILFAYDMAISALREYDKREGQKPLTWEELIQMIGNPVWIVDQCGGGWEIVGNTSFNGKYIRLADRMYDDNFREKSLYGETWLAYRGELREV